MQKIIGFIGLPGSGKTTASLFLEELGFKRINPGEITIEILKSRNAKINEENEKKIRDELREKHGMTAYAKLIIPKIKELLDNNQNKIIIDNIISFDEIMLLKQEFKDNIVFVNITSNIDLRIKRLSERKIRPLTEQEVKERDNHQLNILNMKKTIENVDLEIKNNKTIEEFKNELKTLLKL